MSTYCALLLLALAALPAARAGLGQVTLVAGTGVPGATASPAVDGATGVSTLASPRRVEWDPASETVLVGDYQSSSIRQYDPATGITTTLAGNGVTNYAPNVDGAGADARFGPIRGLAAVDGVLYVSDEQNNVIRAVATDTGVTTTIAGDGTQGEADGVGVLAQFFKPQCLTADPDTRTLYVGSGRQASGTNIKSLRAINLDTNAVTTIRSLEDSGLDGVNDIQFVAPDTLLISDQAYVKRLALSDGPSGDITLIAGAGNYDRDVCTPPGIIDGVGAAANIVPQGLTYDPNSGTIFAVDRHSTNVRAISLETGTVTTVAGGCASGSGGTTVDGVGADAIFNYPEAIAFDGDRRVYVVDVYSHGLRSVEVFDEFPTAQPTTAHPTAQPTTAHPTAQPTTARPEVIDGDSGGGESAAMDPMLVPGIIGAAVVALAICLAAVMLKKKKDKQTGASSTEMVA